MLAWPDDAKCEALTWLAPQSGLVSCKMPALCVALADSGARFAVAEDVSSTNRLMSRTLVACAANLLHWQVRKMHRRAAMTTVLHLHRRRLVASSTGEGDGPEDSRATCRRILSRAPLAFAARSPRDRRPGEEARPRRKRVDSFTVSR